VIETPEILAWPLVAAQLLIFGTAAFALTAAPGSGANRDGSSESLAALWRWLAVVILVATPLRFLTVAAGMADASIRDVFPLVAQIMRETFAGRVWAWRMATAILLAVAAWAPARPMRRAAMIVAVSALLLIFQSITSHAVDKGAFAMTVHFVHQAAAGLWIGALVSLLIGASYSHANAQWLRAATSRVSAVAGWSVAVLAVTGAVRVWNALGLRVDLLLYSLYGRTLLWKLATAASVILLGGYNRYRLVPAIGEPPARATLIRNVTVECILLIAVVGWSVVLASTPPPH
jgi:putative copper export protein